MNNSGIPGRVIILLILIIGVAYFNYVAIVEAFGSGPPYFSQTTNMDKWTNPLPYLIVLDVAVLLIVYYLQFYRKKAKK